MASNGNSNCCGSEIKSQKMSTELELFDDVFPELLNVLTKQGLNNPQISDAAVWFKEVYLTCINQSYGKVYIFHRTIGLVRFYIQLDHTKVYQTGVF